MFKSRCGFLLMALFSLFILTGCATISNQPSQKVAFSTSNGESVVAEINGRDVTLPATVNISRRGGAKVKVLSEKNPCYRNTEFVVVGKHKLSLWFWGNIFTSGTWGSTTDAVSGSMWEYANPSFIVPVSKKKDCE